MAQCIDETGHVILGDDKSVVDDVDGFLEDLFNYAADTGELVSPSQMYSTPIANTETLTESSKPKGLSFENVSAVNSATQEVLKAQKTIDFWKNYVKRINLDLQGLSKSLEN